MTGWHGGLEPAELGVPKANSLQSRCGFTVWQGSTLENNYGLVCNSRQGLHESVPVFLHPGKDQGTGTAEHASADTQRQARPSTVLHCTVLVNFIFR